MSNKKLFKCPFCELKYIEKQGTYEHMEFEHKDELHGLSASQVFFNYRNKYALSKGYGRSVISGLPTKWNEVTERYERFANEKERQQYREYFKNNMIKKYGKDTLLTDPEQQKKMLANRSISGIYTWENGNKTTFTGSYEKKFLEFLDQTYQWNNPNDIMAPAPMIFKYTDSEKKDRFHIPDFYISSLNLIVNIKSKTNQGYRLRDIENERAEDRAIKNSSFNYLKIYDNDFSDFIEVVEKLKDSENNTRIFIESYKQN